MSSESTQDGVVSFSLTVGGKQLERDAYPIVSLTVDKTINKIPWAKVVIYDGDPAQQEFPIVDSNALTIGSDIIIKAGYDGSEQPIFQGVIVKQAIQARSHAAPVLILDCRDIAYRTTLLPKNVRFVSKGSSGLKDSQILTEIVGAYRQLTIEAETTTVQHESLAQLEITDWDFINLRAEANGQVVIVEDGKITVKKPITRQSAAFSFTYGVNMNAFEVEMDARQQWQGAEGKVWEPEQQTIQAIQVPEPGECSFGDVGYSQLSSVNQQDPRVLYHSGELAEQEMETLAKSLLTLSRMAKIQGKISTQGLPTAKPGQVIEIAKSARSFQGNAYVTGIRHKITEGSWMTELTLGLPNQRHMCKYSDVAALPVVGTTPPVHGLQIGIVKKIIEDPQTAYRIFVYLPMVHKSGEGIWCRIASFYASKEAGAFFMPELEDEVVLGFVNADPCSPVIVGSLYSTKHKPPAKSDKDNATKTFTSKSKLVLTFQDKDKEIIIQTPGKRVIKISDKKGDIEIVNGSANKIILGKKDVEIFSKQDITLNASRSINIKANSSVALTGTGGVNIKGSNVTVSADMKAAVTGKTSTELTSSGSTVVKGTMVQIN